MRSRFKMTRLDVARVLEEFLEGTGGPYAWDDYTLGMRFEDKQLEDIRLRCARLSEEFPPTQRGHYCSEPGLDVLREYVRQLRATAGD